MHHPQETTGETWRFTTTSGDAERVFLVLDCPTTPSRWIEMHRATDAPDTWTVETAITPGRTRLRYFTLEAGAYLNYGTVGLHAERAKANEPAVAVDDLDMVA